MKKILFLVMLLLLSSNVFAVLNDSLYYYFPFDTDAQNKAPLAPYNGTVYGAMTRTANGCISGSCANFTSASLAKLDMGLWPAAITATQNHSINFMVRMDKTQNPHNFIKDNASASFPTYIVRATASSFPSSVQFTNRNVNPNSTTNVINGLSWQMVTLVYNTTSATMYINATKVYDIPFSGNVTAGRGATIGGSGNGDQLVGLMDNVAIWNRSLSLSEIQTLYINNGTINGTAAVPQGSYTVTDNNISGYVRNWVINATGACAYDPTLVLGEPIYQKEKIIVQLFNNTAAVTSAIDGSRCNSSNISYVSFSYTPAFVGVGINYTLKINNSIDGDFGLGTNQLNYAANFTRTYDAASPTINYFNVSVPNTLSRVVQNQTYALNCTDDALTTLPSYIFDNTTLLNITNTTRNALWSFQGAIRTGTKQFIATCSDYFGNTTQVLAKNIYNKQIKIVNEVNGTAFGVANGNVTVSRLYFLDNVSYYNFKSTLTTDVNYTGDSLATLRYETGYVDNSVFPVIFNPLYISENPMLICANDYGVSRVEQSIISATQRPAIMQNKYSKCYIAGELTQYAYQNSYLLNAWSINSLYYLNTYSDGTQNFLASIDGSKEGYVNLDAIELQKQSYNVQTLTGQIAFSKTDVANQTLIRYYNAKNDNIVSTISITRKDINVEVFDSQVTTTPNDFYVLFNYGSLDNITESTTFKVTVTSQTASGTTTTSVLMNTQAKSGLIPSGIAFALSVIVMIGGISLISSRLVFGWFGIVVIVIAMGILSLGVPSWYTGFLFAIELIVMLYMIMIMMNSGGQAQVT